MLDQVPPSWILLSHLWCWVWAGPQAEALLRECGSGATSLSQHMAESSAHAMSGDWLEFLGEQVQIVQGQRLATFLLRRTRPAIYLTPATVGRHPFWSFMCKQLCLSQQKTCMIAELAYTRCEAVSEVQQRMAWQR